MAGLNQKYTLCVFVVFFTTAIIKSLCVGRKSSPLVSGKFTVCRPHMTHLFEFLFSFLHQHKYKTVSAENRTRPFCCHKMLQSFNKFFQRVSRCVTHHTHVITQTPSVWCVKLWEHGTLLWCSHMSLLHGARHWAAKTRVGRAGVKAAVLR